MRTKKFIKGIVFVIMVAVLGATSYQPVMAAEKISRADFVAKIYEGTETDDLYENLNEAGEGAVLHIYDKSVDKTQKGAVKTSRGIYIGSKVSTVIQKYGKGTKGKLINDIAYINFSEWKDYSPYFKNVDYVLSYQYDEKTKLGEVFTSTIHFYIDKNEKVADIAFSRYYKEGKKDSSYYYNKGYSYYEEDNYKAAIAYLHICIKIDPEFTDAYITLGDSYYYLSRYSKALVYFEKAITLPLGDTAYVNYSKGLALHYDGRYEEAITSYERAIEQDPTFIEGYNCIGDSLIMLNKYDDARKMYDKVLELQPDNVNANNGKGDSFYYQEQYLQAMEYYNKAISSDPTFKMAYYNKAYTLYVLEKYEDCLVVCDKLIGIDANYADAYYIKSKIYALQNNEAELLENLKKAVDIDQSFIEGAETEAVFSSYRNSSEFKKIISTQDK